MFQDLLNKADTPERLTSDDLLALLSTGNDKEIAALHQKAYSIKLAEVGPKAYFRGIIEFSNICDKDCYYCGIRKSNSNQSRFRMSKDEIVKAAVWAYDNNYGSIVLQSGELATDAFVDFVESCLLEIGNQTNNDLGITLSLGEQTEDTYKRWYTAGAHRYLLRIETTNPSLYASLHPADHHFDERIDCLDRLRRCGYQVGTGVMAGLPGQTLEDLVNDIIFFKEHDIDMIGMGPYIPHHETPMKAELESFDAIEKIQRLTLGLKMIAVTRLYLRDVNIAATTALQALHSKGREMGLMAGANIIMPNVTDTKYRAAYQLYDNKPCIDENSSMCRGCLTKRVQGVGETIGFGEWGDSPHFLKKEETA